MTFSRECKGINVIVWFLRSWAGQKLRTPVIEGGIMGSKRYIEVGKRMSVNPL
jgi:hypothetical protein